MLITYLLPGNLPKKDTYLGKPQGFRCKGFVARRESVFSHKFEISRSRYHTSRGFFDEHIIHREGRDIMILNSTIYIYIYVPGSSRYVNILPFW